MSNPGQLWPVEYKKASRYYIIITDIFVTFRLPEEHVENPVLISCLATSSQDEVLSQV